MASEIARIDEWGGGRERRIERAIVMHGTSDVRRELARLVARLVDEAGISGAAAGWADRLAPNLVTPVLAVSGRPNVRWHLDAKHMYSVTLHAGSDRTWSLVAPGLTPERASAHRVMIAYLEGRCANALDRDCPKVPSEALSGSHGRLISLFDALRCVGFVIRNPEDVGFFVSEFMKTVSSLPDAVNGPAVRAIESIGDFDRLGSALLEFGIALDVAGLLHEAAAIHVIGYELALSVGDGNGGVDAARWAGRAFRKLAVWDEAGRWYGLAAEVAQFEEDWGRLAIVLDGQANVHRDRGAFPQARELYLDSLRVAVLSGQADPIARAHHGLSFVARTSGDLEDALKHGWAAVTTYPTAEWKGVALIELAGVFADLGLFDASEDAYAAGAELAVEADARILGRLGISWMAAMKGESVRHDRVYAEVAAATSTISPRATAQVLVYRGRSLGLLGRTKEASATLEHAIRFCRDHELHRLVFTAEAALEAVGREPRPEPRPAMLERTAEIRADVADFRNQMEPA